MNWDERVAMIDQTLIHERLSFECADECADDCGACAALSLIADVVAERAAVVAGARSLLDTWDRNAAHSRGLIHRGIGYRNEQLALMAAEVHEKCAARLREALDIAEPVAPVIDPIAQPVVPAIRPGSEGANDGE